MKKVGYISWLWLLGLLVFSGCEKDIDIDYRKADPLYVVEAAVTDAGMQARVSQTQAMDDNSTVGVTGAQVTITGSDGSREVLEPAKNGWYLSNSRGIVGVTYQIDVLVGGQHFTSTSVMQRAPKVNKFHFIWKEMMNQRFLVGELLFQDIPNEDNWYFSHIYRNNIGYRWAVKRDDTGPNKELQQLFTIAREGSDDQDMLKDGDLLRIELSAVDERVYDYLYSMQIMDNTGTNPIANFSGGCLGYFSAYTEVVIYHIFHLEDVEEEEK